MVKGASQPVNLQAEVEPDQFRTFRDLVVWQEARLLRRKMYGVARQLPDYKKFNAVSQIRRAALSLTNNIAEGHGRFHFQENIQFLRQSRGSLEELIDDLTLCEDEHYIPEAELQELHRDAAAVRRLLNGYIRYLKERKTASANVVRETLAPYESDTEDDVDSGVPALTF